MRSLVLVWSVYTLFIALFIHVFLELPTSTLQEIMIYKMSGFNEKSTILRSQVLAENEIYTMDTIIFLVPTCGICNLFNENV